MCKKLSELSFRLKLRRLFSGVIILAYKMVRYFPNSYPDYESNSEVVIDKDEVVQQIEEHLAIITKRLHPSSKTVSGGLYVGTTGISFMYYYLSKNPVVTRNEYMVKSMEYLKPALETSTGDKTSFLLGDAGTHALAAVVKKKMGDESYSENLKIYQSLYNLYLNPKFLKCGGDEFFVGRAGYLAGTLWISRELNSPVLSREEIYKICDIMVASGKEFSAKIKSPCPLMYHYYSTQYLGAAHGISFILQMILSVPGYMQFNKSAANDIKLTIEYIASLQNKEGNWPCCMEEAALPDHKLVHWCHGAPGIIYLMAKAYLVYKDAAFLNSCVRAGDLVWNKGLLRKGPGICHGVAGNGYVFLLLFRLTRDVKYLYRAKVFADFMNSDEFIRDARLPDNPESLYEGIAGTVCFLADLLYPDKAEFPFQDVFSTYPML